MTKKSISRLLQASLMCCLAVLFTACDDIFASEDNPIPAYLSMSDKPVTIKVGDTYRRNVSYIQLPVFARLAWGKEQKGLQFFFQAGPQIGFCIGDNSKRSSQWTTDEQGVPLRPNNVVAQYDLDIERKFDYGIAGGLGLEYNSPVGHFIFEGRYYYGLADMFGNSKKDPFARSANGTIHVKLAYLMDLQKVKD